MSDPRFAPDFDVVIDGQPVPAPLRASISSVSLQTGLEGADRVELSVVNEGLRWLDSPLLALDRQLALRIGYTSGQLEQVFDGEIVSQTPTFSGSPTIAVAAQDRRRRLQRGSKARWFTIPALGTHIPIPDLLIADLVSLENLLVPNVDAAGVVQSLGLYLVNVIIGVIGGAESMQRLIRRQNDESDMDFLKRIALENGWELLMRHDGPVGGYELHFLAPLQHLSPDITLTYGRSLIEFTPRITSVGQAIGFSASFWISAIKTQVTASIGWDWDRQSFDVNISFGFGLPSWVDTTPEAAAAAVRRERADRESGEPATPEQQREFDAETDQLAEKERQGVQRQIDRDNAQTRFTLVDEPVTPETVARVLVGKLLPKLNSRLTGSGSTVGDLRIKPGGVIKFEGLGAQFSGLYRVVSATHTIDGGGYRTSFDVRKEIWFGSIPPYDQGMVPVRLMGQRLGA